MQNTAAYLPGDVGLLKYLTSYASTNRPGTCCDGVRLVRLYLMMFLPANNHVLSIIRFTVR